MLDARPSNGSDRAVRVSSLKRSSGLFCSHARQSKSICVVLAHSFGQFDDDRLPPPISFRVLPDGRHRSLLPTGFGKGRVDRTANSFVSKRKDHAVTSDESLRVDTRAAGRRRRFPHAESSLQKINERKADVYRFEPTDRFEVREPGRLDSILSSCRRPELLLHLTWFSIPDALRTALPLVLLD